MNNSLTVPHANNRWHRLISRLLDLSVALPALVVFMPLVALVALLVMLDSPGNPFFMQQRIGKNGKRFTMFKFRTLYLEHFGLFTDQEAPHAYRVTRIGKYLRRSKLDELPQFLNVLLGQMALVGPRPDLPIHVEKYVALQQERLLVKPGLTGLAQVSGNTALSWPERILLDRWYINNHSWLLDVKIVGCTLSSIFSGDHPNRDPLKVHRFLPEKGPVRQPASFVP